LFSQQEFHVSLTSDENVITITAFQTFNGLFFMRPFHHRYAIRGLLVGLFVRLGLFLFVRRDS